MPNDAFRFSIGKEVFEFDLSDVDGREARAYRKEVGLSIPAALQGIEEGDIDVLEVLAGLKWLIQRRDNRALSFDQVLGSVTYDNIDFEPGGDADPPDPGANTAPASPPSPITSTSSPGSSTSSPKASALTS